MKQREHVWGFEDCAITLYYFKFGTKHLPVKDDVELSEEIIGTSVESLKAQSANILFLIGDSSRGIPPGTSGLTDVSKAQKEATDKYDELSEPELREIILNIINSRDRVENREKIKTIKREKEIAVKLKQQKLNDNKFFKSLGKDPSKMKSLGKRPVIA